MREAVRGCRSGEGPAVVVADVVRLLPHSSSDNQAKYRRKEELDAERARDPIPRLEAELIRRGELTPDGALAMREETKRIVDAAADAADASPFPDPQTARRNVYARETYAPPAGASETPRTTGETNRPRRCDQPRLDGGDGP